MDPGLAGGWPQPHLGGITLRLSDEDFAGIRSHDGVIRWPIGTAELEQHYSDLERQLGVFGARDGLAQLPDGAMSDALPSTDAEQRFAEAVRNRLGHAVIQSRGFAAHAPERKDDWPSSSSRGSTLQRAIATGRVDVMADQMVERLCLGADASTATGVVAVDQTNGDRRTLSADLVILCASTIQTVSILLRTRQFSSGGAVVDPSVRLGTRLMDHVSSSQFFAMPGSRERPQPPLSGAGSFFLPFGRHLSEASFQGGYGLWGGIGRFDPPSWLQRRSGTVTGFLIGHGEVEPRVENRVTLSDRTDRWGVTVPHIDCRWGESEQAMVTHMRRTMAECIEAADGQALEIRELFHLPFLEPFLGGAVALSKQAAPPGYYIHEVGGAAMGEACSDSVVDSNNRLWRCRNVLVVDGACWPTSAWRATLTMMAIARRAQQSFSSRAAEQVVQVALHHGTVLATRSGTEVGKSGTHHAVLVPVGVTADELLHPLIQDFRNLRFETHVAATVSGVLETSPCMASLKVISVHSDRVAQPALRDKKATWSGAESRVSELGNSVETA